jgi:hypothetical protein
MIIAIALGTDWGQSGRTPPSVMLMPICVTCAASQECWFCLSGANVEKHMVVSVGMEMYIALAKGMSNQSAPIVR